MLSRLPKLLRRVLLSVVAFFLFLVIAERLLDSPTILLLWSCCPVRRSKTGDWVLARRPPQRARGWTVPPCCKAGRTGEFSYLDSLLRPYRARQYTVLEVEPVAI